PHVMVAGCGLQSQRARDVCDLLQGAAHPHASPAGGKARNQSVYDQVPVGSRDVIDPFDSPQRLAGLRIDIFRLFHSFIGIEAGMNGRHREPLLYLHTLSTHLSIISSRAVTSASTLKF